MPVYIAFLRSINVGKRRVKMAALAGHFTDLGCQEVRTHLASGNVIFKASKSARATLETRISKGLEKALGFAVDVFVRTPDEVRAVLETPRFESIKETDTVHVFFHREPLSVSVAGALTAVKTPVDAFAADGTEYYWHCRTRVSESKVFALPEVKRLRLPVATARSTESLRKLLLIL